MIRTKQLVLSAAAVLAVFGAAQTAATPAAAKGKHMAFGFHKPHFAGPRVIITHGHGYGYGCGWLWRKYLVTGHPYWKFRYFECIG